MFLTMTIQADADRVGGCEAILRGLKKRHEVTGTVLDLVHTASRLPEQPRPLCCWNGLLVWNTYVFIGHSSQPSHSHHGVAMASCIVAGHLQCMQFHCSVLGWSRVRIRRGRDLTIITIVVCGVSIIGIIWLGSVAASVVVLMTLYELFSGRSGCSFLCANVNYG